MNFNPLDPAYRKYGVAALGLAAQVLDLVAPVVPERYKPWVAVGIALLTALGVRQLRNVPSLQLES